MLFKFDSMQEIFPIKSEGRFDFMPLLDLLNPDVARDDIKKCPLI